MYCRNCGKEVPAQAVICVACGVAPLNGNRFCQHCGATSDPAAAVCIKCGVALLAGMAGAGLGAQDLTLKSKMAAGLLGIFLGWLGVHRFYLGYTGIGVAQLVLGLLGVVTCGITTGAASIWGLIEGILILTGSINRDASGRPLRD